MKKVFFAAFAGACVLTSILATTDKVNVTAGRQPSLDTVPPKDTSKIINVAYLRDTVPPKDTTKLMNLAMLQDTVPPKDTTKMMNLAILRDTVPPKDTTKMMNLAILRDTVPPTDTSKIARIYALAMFDTIPGRKYDTTKRPSDTTSLPRLIDVAMR